MNSLILLIEKKVAKDKDFRIKIHKSPYLYSFYKALQAAPEGSKDEAILQMVYSFIDIIEQLNVKNINLLSNMPYPYQTIANPIANEE